MFNIIHRSWQPTLAERMRESTPLIQILLGPRQVGKTTSITQLADEWPGQQVVFKSADDQLPEGSIWIEQAWREARSRQSADSGAQVLLILDEIQKIPQWSETVKRLWDEDIRHRRQLCVVMSGSSALTIQKGLSESLAGRFEIIPATHLSFSEFVQITGRSLDHFIFFGGYPGALNFIDDERRWSQYILQSIIESVLSRDILLLTRVDKPALLRRLFQIGCEFSGQLISYQKMLGQLQDAGNTTTLAHYLTLLDQAYLLRGLHKFEPGRFRRRASSPKLQVHNNALMSVMSRQTFAEVRRQPDLWGRYVESAVGAHLVNLSRIQGFDLSYWREANQEVDFVLSMSGRHLAIEVKSGRRGKLAGLKSLKDKFKNVQAMVVDESNLADFLRCQDMETLLG